MQQTSSPSGRIKRLRLIPLLSLIAGILLLLFLFTGKDNLIALYRLHNDVAHMHQNLTGANYAIDSLKQEIQRLKTDTTYLERIARERLGMARKTEKIYKFIDKR